MARQHSPLQVVREAKQIAQDHGLFVCEKRGVYLLYRNLPFGASYLGRSVSPSGLRGLVCRVAGFK